MQGCRLLILALVGGLATGQAMAACMSSPDGWFLEANGGSSHLSGKSYAPGSANASGIGGNANFGYKFMPYVAAEAGYSLYPNNTIDAPDGTHAATDKHYSYDLAVRGLWPFGASGFEGFAKLGAGRVSSHVSLNNAQAAKQAGITSSSQRSATGVYLGLGAQYYLIPEVAVVAQWQRVNGNSATGSEDLFTAGLSVLFS